jgi:hypothetical protein
MLLTPALNLLPVLTTLVVHLSPVSLTPEGIAWGIFKTMALKDKSGAWEKIIHEKT